MVEQLSMFGAQSIIFAEAESIAVIEGQMEVVPFDRNDNVKVVVPKLVRGNAESHYYLSDLAGKRGRVLKVIAEPSLQYEVDFDGKIAIVYHEELKYW